MHRELLDALSVITEEEQRIHPVGFQPLTDQVQGQTLRHFLRDESLA